MFRQCVRVSKCKRDQRADGDRDGKCSFHAIADPLISLAGESPRGKCMLNHIRYSLATLNVPPHGHDFDGTALCAPPRKEIPSMFAIM